MEIILILVNKDLALFAETVYLTDNSDDTEYI